MVKLGSEVQGFSEGDRVVADVMRKSQSRFRCASNMGLEVMLISTESCHHCVYCKQGKPLFCLNLRAQGCTEPGGFAEYVAL